jgi:formamidopyrimidine-DNA glycosylase
MPELPEVETIVRDLGRLITGATIVDVRVIRPDLIEREPPESFAAHLRGRRIEGVSRRAKNIVLDLGGERLVVNLGMTGRLLVLGPGDGEPSHPGVELRLEDGRRLVYHDVRRFGRLERADAAAWAARDEALGLEPLSPAFTPEALHDLASRSRVAVKTWLMDQRRVVGVGNIYASEALFRAGIDPRRPARSLSRDEAARLHDAVREVLHEAIDYRGTTLLDYRDAAGERGGFAERLRVYDRAGRPCRACGAPIRRVVQGGRSTFYCAACQR